MLMRVFTFPIPVGLVLIAILAALVFVKLKPDSQVSFLERTATTLERAETIAPETRDHLSQVLASYQTPSRDQRLEARRERALSRIADALKTSPRRGAALEPPTHRQ
jgi:uncharacterized membrane protein